MTEAPLRAALLGYGYAGKTFHAPLIAETPGWELACVASSRPDAVHVDLPGVRVVADPLQAICGDGIDVVVVATPNAQHAPLAEAALRAGRHVVVDKPFTLDLTQARRLRDVARDSQRIVSVFHNRRWDSDFLGIRALIESGRLGEVVHFESHFDRYRPQVRDRWRERAQGGGGIWFDLGPHLVDQALQLFGLPLEVSADIAALRPNAEADDWAHVVLRYERLRVILHAGMLVAGGSERFIAHGTAGSVVKAGLDPQEAQLLAGVHPGAPGWGVDDEPLRLFAGDGAVQAIAAPAGDQRAYYAGLRDAIRDGAPPPVTDAQALAVMAVIEAGFESTRARSAVALALDQVERRAFEAPRAPAAL